MYTKIEIPELYKNAMMMTEKDLNLAKASVSHYELTLKNIILELYLELGKSKKEFGLIVDPNNVLCMVNIEEYNKYQENPVEHDRSKEEQQPEFKKTESEDKKANIVDLKEVKKSSK